VRAVVPDAAGDLLGLGVTGSWGNSSSATVEEVKVLPSIHTVVVRCTSPRFGASNRSVMPNDTTNRRA
jgi:hypothetical protein